MKKDEEIIFRVSIKNSTPVDLMEYTKSLMSLSSEFVSYCEHNNIGFNGDVKLYIKEVRSGSIISDLIAYAPAVLPCVEYANSLFDFYKNLSGIFDYLLGRKGERPDLTKKTLVNIENLMMPAINDNNGSMSFEIVQGNKVINNYYITNEQQNIIQNRARNEALIQTTEEKEYKNVSFYWYQARNTESESVADKGIIESISQKPIKTIMSVDIKKRMITGNLFEVSYIVDVRTICAKGKIIAYEVINLIDVISDQ